MNDTLPELSVIAPGLLLGGDTVAVVEPVLSRTEWPPSPAPDPAKSVTVMVTGAWLSAGAHAFELVGQAELVSVSETAVV